MASGRGNLRCLLFGTLCALSARLQGVAGELPSLPTVPVPIRLYIRNAFDSVLWYVISATLKEWGLGDQLLNIIKSFLSNRPVSISTEIGDKRFVIKVRPPQGLVLGPSLECCIQRRSLAAISIGDRGCRVCH